MRKSWIIVGVISAAVSGMSVSAEVMESPSHKSADVLNCGSGAMSRGWLDPSFDRERLNLNTAVKDFSILRGHRYGEFSSTPSITLLVSRANLDDFEVTQSILYADFYGPQQNGCIRGTRQKISVTTEGQIIASSYDGSKMELAHWDGSSLIWNSRYEVIFPLVDIFCKYENCVPDYSGGPHIGMRFRERIKPTTTPLTMIESEWQ